MIVKDMRLSDCRRQILSSLLAAMAAGKVCLAVAAAPAVSQLAPVGGEEPVALHRAALPPATRFTLAYDVYYGDFMGSGLQVASALYHFRSQGGRYRIDTEARASGVLAMFYSGTLLQSSEGLLDEKGLVPERYTEKRGHRPERRYVFDASSRRIRQEGDPAIDFPYPEGTQDRLSIFFQLGQLARAEGRPLRTGRTVTLPLAGSRRIDEALLQIKGMESIRTGAGGFDALHIAASKPGDDDAPRFDLWLAPELKMLPVRIRVLDHGAGGKIIDQVLGSRPAGF